MTKEEQAQTIFGDQWQCMCCGTLKGIEGDNPASWRWNGECWEHQCWPTEPQIGYFMARNVTEQQNNERLE